MSTTEEWIGQAGERKEGFLIGLRDTSSLHLTAIDCLEELFERNPERLRIGHRNIIIIGDLAL